MSDESTSGSQPPTADDGFHEPAADTKRRNLLTAAIIVACLTFWVLFGLRRPLMDWLF